jgi:1-hydroxycarotenoid 3,4-desaturase
MFNVCQILLRTLDNRARLRHADAVSPDVLVIGAGIGGLAAALRLAGAGLDVLVCERHAAVGGKMRVADVAGQSIDTGPTVLTMRHVLDGLFDAIGLPLGEYVGLRPLDRLARHLWPDGGRLDLFADEDRSAAAIAELAGERDAEGYRRFCARGRALLDLLEGPFLAHEPDGMFALARRIGMAKIGALARIDWHRSMWSTLEEFFIDPKLRQLFGRYATYFGSSPFLAPATMNLIAQVEQRGVWVVDGGMIELARGLQRAFERFGGRVLLACEAERIVEGRRGVESIVLADGIRVRPRAVVFNGEPAALVAGALGPDARGATAASSRPRSLSANTWALVAAATGEPLAYHTVAFGADSRVEFDELFAGRLPPMPTVYVCAQDRGPRSPPPSDRERLFCLTNAPPLSQGGGASEESTCRAAMLDQLARCGVTLNFDPAHVHATTNADFADAFPHSQGALYGPATHSAWAPFRRPPPRTSLPNLHLVGGSTHPGAGVPMVMLGGISAATRILNDLRAGLPSTRPSHPEATSGGTSTASTSSAARR